MKVSEVRLVAGRGGEGPVAEEGAEGMGGCAAGAGVAGIPDTGAAGGGGGRTGDGAVGGEGVVEGVVFEAALDEYRFVDGTPGVGPIGTPFVVFAPVEPSCSVSDSL